MLGGGEIEQKGKRTQCVDRGQGACIRGLSGNGKHN